MTDDRLIKFVITFKVASIEALTVLLLIRSSPEDDLFSLTSVNGFNLALCCWEKEHGVNVNALWDINIMCGI